MTVKFGRPMAIGVSSIISFNFMTWVFIAGIIASFVAVLTFQLLDVIKTKI